MHGIFYNKRCNQGVAWVFNLKAIQAFIDFSDIICLVMMRIDIFTSSR